MLKIIGIIVLTAMVLTTATAALGLTDALNGGHLGRWGHTVYDVVTAVCGIIVWETACKEE